MIVAVALQAPAPPIVRPAAGLLVPPLDTPLRYRIEQTRTVGGYPLRFTLERRVVFHRSGDDLTAEVTLTAAAPAATGGVARRFAAAAAALQGRTLVFHLDAAGRVRSVDDADAVWTAIVTGVARSAAPLNPATKPATDRIAALGRLPADARLPIIASALAPVLATADAAAPTGSRAVTLDSALLGGGGALAGTRTVTRPAPDRVVLTTVATGTAGTASTRLERVRTVDAATGLLVSERETTDTVLDGVTQQVVQTVAFTRW